MATDDRSLRAAAFLAQALDLADAPDALAADLVALDRDPAVAVFAAEFDSSVGPAAFLIYAYALPVSDSDGRTGRDRFAADLATLQTAADRDVPGPRAVAHALTDTDGFILATTPATLRALTGETVPDGLDAGAADLLPTADPSAARGAAAAELLRLLRLADTQAAAWLAAVAAERHRRPAGDDPTASTAFAFTPEETELALFLLDDRLRHLFRALNSLLADAHEQTTGSARPDA
jgi:hypothetical protein